MILRVTEKSKCSNCTSIVVVYKAYDPGNPSLLRHGKGIEANAPISLKANKKMFYSYQKR